MHILANQMFKGAVDQPEDAPVATRAGGREARTGSGDEDEGITHKAGPYSGPTLRL